MATNSSKILNFLLLLSILGYCLCDQLTISKPVGEKVQENNNTQPQEVQKMLARFDKLISNLQENLTEKINNYNNFSVKLTNLSQEYKHASTFLEIIVSKFIESTVIEACGENETHYIFDSDKLVKNTDHCIEHKIMVVSWIANKTQNDMDQLSKLLIMGKNTLLNCDSSDIDLCLSEADFILHNLAESIRLQKYEAEYQFQETIKIVNDYDICLIEGITEVNRLKNEELEKYFLEILKRVSDCFVKLDDTDGPIFLPDDESSEVIASQ